MQRERADRTAAAAGAVTSGALEVLLAGPTICRGPTSFIDVPRLLSAVEVDALTGHVQVDGPGFGALVVLVCGRIVAARFHDGSAGTVRGIEALRCLDWRAARGDGQVRVAEFDEDRAEAASHLITGHPLVGGLRSRFAVLDALIDYLAEVALDGTLVVEGEGRTAVVLFSAGRVRRCFWGGRSVVGRLPTAVRVVVADPAARIDVLADARWARARMPEAEVPALVLQGRQPAGSRRRSSLTVVGGGAA